MLRIRLRYADGRSLIDGMRRVSKPSRRVYVDVRHIPRVRRGLGIAVLSTPRGVLSDRQAREQQVGGEAGLRGLVAMSRIGRRPVAIPSGVTVA